MDARTNPDQHPPPRARRAWRRRRAAGWVWAGITLLIGLAATLLTWYASSAREDAAERVQFEFVANNLVGDVTDRLQINVQALWGAAGLLAANPDVTRAQWRAYVDALQLPERLSGTSALGYAKRVSAQEQAAHVAEMRRQGFENYAIWPAGGRGEAVVVTYIEPLVDRLVPVLGYDVASGGAERGAALERARDTGEPTLSSRITLLRRPDEPSFILFLPIYRGGAHPASVEERREALTGYVYAAFRASEFIQSRGIAQQAAQANAALEIFDGPVAQEEHLLFRSPDFPQALPPSVYATTVAELVAGRTWLFRIAALRPFTQYLQSQAPFLILISGLLISALASAVVGTLAVNRAQAVEANERLRADMVRRLHAEEQLRQSETKYRQLFDSIPLPIFAIDRATLRYVEVNEAAVEKYGFSHAEFAGMHISDIRPPEDVPFMLRYMESVRNEAQYGGEFRHRLKSGELIDVDVTGHNIDLDGRQATIVLANDITARKAAQRALAESEQQLRQAQKLEAIGQLTGGIAHEFNNILTVITGTIEVLADGVTHNPTLVTIARLIDDAAQRGADLTRGLLAFARRQSLEPRATDINALVAGASKLLRSTLGEHIEIRSKLDAELWPAFVDPSQLTTALLNLAINARDAMAEGGVLALETANIELDEAYARAADDVKPGAYVMIAVSDTGGGIPEAIREKVLEPFFTTKEVGKGTGLGLSMVYGFIKQSGGHLQIYSEQGYGTSVKIYLPRADAQASDAPPVAPEVVGGSETILVVEDDALVRTYVTQQLHGLGYKTRVAANAAEALAIVEEGFRFELLFTDIVMPGPMNGRALATEVRKRRPGVRILFTSGYTDEAAVQGGRLDPGAVLLSKPYRTAELARKIREALERAPADA
jgi:PAS domain S-box-containing protein